MESWPQLQRLLWTRRRRTAGGPAIDARLRPRFIAVAAVTIGATLAVVAAIVMEGARSERAALEARARLLARSSALMIDREMSRLDALLTGLATSPALKTGDLRAFHAQAATMPKPEGCWILLFDGDMQQRVNAQWPWGTPLSIAAERSQQAMTQALSHARFTNLVYAPNQKRYVAAIVVPVDVEGLPGSLLVATVPAETVGKVIGELDLPAGWFAGIFDREGVTIDRVPARPDFVGQPAPAPLVAAMRAAQDGALEGLTREGVPLLTTFSRSGVSGWTATVGVPLAELEAPQKRSLRLLAIGGSFVLLAGIGGTAVLGRRLARPAAEQLALSDERFRNIADNAPVLIWMSDPEKKSVYFSKPWLAFTGRTLEQERGDGWLEGVHPEDRERVAAVYSSHFDARRPFSTEYRLRRADGAYRWIEDCGVPQLGRDGTFFGYIGACIDITERQIAAQAIRESEERFRVMAETVPAMLFTAGPDGRCDYANQRYHAYVGTSAATVGEIDLAARVHPDDALGTLSEWVICVEGGTPYSGELRLRAADGTYRWFAIRAHPVRDADGSIVRWLASALDIDDLKQALLSLKEVAGRLLDLQAEERRRLARELHDSTAQVLVASSLDLARLRQSLGAREGRAAELVAELVSLNDQALKEIRTLSYLFHPPVLEAQGLEAALRAYIAGFAKRSGVAVSTELAPGAGPLPHELEAALFRVAQESLVNIHRHSGSAKAHVRLRRAGSSVVLEIEDEGKGFPLAHHGVDEADLGVGIAGMRNRLQQLGGTLEIESGAKGTIVRATASVARPDSTVVDLDARRLAGA